MCCQWFHKPQIKFKKWEAQGEHGKKKVHNEQEDTEAVLTGTAAAEKSRPRNNWDWKKGHLANMNPGVGKTRICGMKQLSESSQMNKKIYERTEEDKLKE